MHPIRAKDCRGPVRQLCDPPRQVFANLTIYNNLARRGLSMFLAPLASGRFGAGPQRRVELLLALILIWLPGLTWSQRSLS